MAIFERFVDFVTARTALYPDLHIYHYAPYEPGALKRLMGRYATRENEIDNFLRGSLLVDLYSVVRNALRAGVESYSIKKLEPLYGFARNTSEASAPTLSLKLITMFPSCTSIARTASRENVSGAPRPRAWLSCGRLPNSA